MADKCVSFCPVKWTGKVEIRAPLSMMVVEALAAASALFLESAFDTNPAIPKP